MPASTAGLADGAHVVQFYSDDAILVDVLARIVGTALVGGDAAVVLTTPAHETALRRRLRQRGLDVGVGEREGRYLTLNATDLLHWSARHSTLDTERFHQMAGDAIRRARAESESEPQRVVVFGEAVGVLVRDGHIEAAVELEKQWNRLLETERFSLCCAYPMQAFRTEDNTAAFLHICGLHSRVFPAERRVFPRVTRSTSALR